ncbi:MAG: penicillin-binding protein 1B [Limisphaerales bacterium]|jgi:penicillin-binding protein 1B
MRVLKISAKRQSKRPITKAKKATNAKRRQSKAKKAKPSLWWWLLKWGTGLGLLVCLAVIGYLIYLDRNVTTVFEGRRWSIPAQVFAQPLELYEGAGLNAAALQTELQRLGYQADANLATPGTYKMRAGTLNVYLRAFHFMERARPATQIEITFAGQQIKQIKNAQGEVPLIRLDPATIGSFFPSHGEDRIILRPDEVPPILSKGLKAIEDRNFDQHMGISISGIIRAAIVNLKAGERQQGGSTLTQQLVKSYFLDGRRTYERKLKEMAMAFILEARFSKEDLLTAYINEIFLGQNGNRAIHGFGLGAQFYFNKPLQELAVDEIATLISIIRGPSYYNPFRHPNRALERRNRILQTFNEDSLINKNELNVALAQPLRVVASPTRGGAYYPAFMDKVRAELRSQYQAEDLSSQGLRVFTTIRPREQENVQRAVAHVLNQIEQDRRLPAASLQAAAVVADTQTGELLALVGGRKGRVDGFNRALNAERPVGSLIKPVVFLAAIETGMNLAQTIVDEPITLQPEYGEPWSPKNFDGKFRGELPLIRALAESLNLATVHLGQQVGLELIQSRFATLTNRQPTNPYPSFMLGAESMSPIKMLELYGNFASGGFRSDPKAVVAVLDEAGRPISHHPFEITQTIQSKDVAALNRALEVAMAKGTGRRSPYAKSGVAGKTGTSNDNRDSWFAGFDNRRVSVVWVGRDDNAKTGLTGGSGALRVWNEMSHHHNIEPLVHPPSDDLVAIEFSTGLLANKDCADIVWVPVADRSSLAIKPGCGIRHRVKDQVKRWFR